jgi:ABC-2 type transport system ATP-binding protein
MSKIDAAADDRELADVDHPPMRIDEPAIRVRGLTKHYGKLVAVDQLDFEVPSGVIAGLIGPNGAGKTTTLAMLLGLVRPSAGDATVLGHPIGDPAAYLRRVGALIETPAFYLSLTGRQNLELLATVAGSDPHAVTALLDQVGLGDRGDDRFRAYSTGMRQRLGIAAALLGDPHLLLLDEPTNGLDPVGKAEMRSLLGRLARPGRSVVVSSHVLAELEQICDWLVIIDKGRLLFQGPTSELLMSARTRLILAPQHRRDLPRLGELLARRGHSVEPRDDHILIAVDGADSHRLAAELNAAAMNGGVVLYELTSAAATLEDRYLAMVAGGNE